MACTSCTKKAMYTLALLFDNPSADSPAKRLRGVQYSNSRRQVIHAGYSAPLFGMSAWRMLVSSSHFFLSGPSNHWLELCFPSLKGREHHHAAVGSQCAETNAHVFQLGPDAVPNGPNQRSSAAKIIQFHICKVDFSQPTCKSVSCCCL